MIVFENDKIFNREEQTNYFWFTKILLIGMDRVLTMKLMKQNTQKLSGKG